jgi:ferredoxin
LYLVNVDRERCEGCEECVNVCPNEVIVMLDGKCDPSGGGECVFCESCVGVCPAEAITITGM